MPELQLVEKKETFYMRPQTEKHAKLYLEKGWSVIPVGARTKVPLLEWKEFTTRRPTIEEVSRWFDKWPDCGIGIVTGPISNLAVVDADGPDGIREAARQKLQSPFISLTGKGKQFFFAYPSSGIKNSVKKWPGLDIRGENGFVVAPPSIHPLGKCYIWEKFLPNLVLPTLPSSFLPETPAPPQSTLRKPDGWIAAALEEMKNGHVHNTLVSVLGKFRAHNFSEHDTIKLLKPFALVDGKPFEGLESKVQEIWRRYQPATLGGPERSETIDTFLEDIKEVDWLCRPFFAKKSIGFVVGLPETLKTWLCIDLAVECAGENGLWLGLFPTTSCRVLFVDQERWKGETQRRFSSVIAAKGISRKSLSDRLFLKSGTTIRLNIDSSYQAFRTELLEMRPELIIVDSFATFHTLPENDRSEIQKVLERIKDLRNEIGCTFLFINHESKMAYPNGEPQGEPTVGTMVGSIGIPAAAEFCLTVRKVQDNTSLVWHTKSTLAQKAKAFYASVIDVPEGVVVRGLND